MSGRKSSGLWNVHILDWQLKRPHALRRSESRLSHLIIHWEERNVRQRSIDGLPTRLQEVLEAFVVLVGPRQSKEVSVVDGPVEWRICRVGLLLRHQRSYARLCACSMTLARDRGCSGGLERQKTEQLG
jgi:hypothetical protein